MEYRVGDVLFSGNGQPGVIADRKRETGEYVVDKRPEDVKKAQRIGYINGLSQTERKGFNEVMEKIRDIEDPEKRVEELSKQIHALGDEPQNRNVAKYLNSEMVHIMHTYRIKAKSYTVDENEI